MDIEKIKNIKKNSDMIKKFRTLDKYKNMNNSEFEEEMKKLLPSFYKDNRPFFEIIIANKDLYFLDLMFHKIDDISKEYESRKNEIQVIEPIVEDIRSLIKVNPDMGKEKISAHIRQTSSDFCNRYPLIIEKLMDKDYVDLPVKQLFLDQIKFKHEKVIGEMLANQYVHSKLNKK
tara:strand:- start:1235 stop:1759 length:525 start_codon:yes stop_codon:yes gene_type:complete